MNSTVALLVNIPTLFLLYVMIYFTQKLSGKRQFYGISLNSDYFDKDEFKNLDKAFKAFVTIGFIIFTSIALLSIFVFNAYNFASIFPMLGFCLYQFIVYVNIHNRVKSLKQELSLSISDLDLPKTKIVFDTEFINDKSKLINKFSILLIIPTLVLTLVGIYVLSQYNSIPDVIPTHWGFSGEADAFSDKTFVSVLTQVGMMVGLGVIICISAISSLKSRAKLSIDKFDESKKANLYYLSKFAISFVILSIGTHIMFINILLAICSGGNVDPYILWPSTVLIIVTAIYQTYIYYKSPNKSKSAVYSVDDDDSMWILGSIYNNPNDPSLFVQKRFGAGWTINIGTTSGKLFFALPFIIILIALIFI